MIDRKTHWENVYREKSALEVSWYQKEPKLSLEFIRRTQIARDDAIIDVGGGASGIQPMLPSLNHHIRFHFGMIGLFFIF